MKTIIIDDNTNQIIYENDCEYCDEEGMTILSQAYNKHDIKIKHKETSKDFIKIWVKTNE